MNRSKTFPLDIFKHGIKVVIGSRDYLLAFATFVWYKYGEYASPTVYHVCYIAERKDNGECVCNSAEYSIRYA